MDMKPLMPNDRTFVMNTLGSAASPGQMASGLVSGQQSIIFNNPESFDQVVGYGLTSTGAQTRATFPTYQNPQTCLFLAAGSIQTFTFPAKMFFSGRADGANNGMIYVTPGDGE